jgi:exodeoxyribonuclease V beta subunit
MEFFLGVGTVDREVLGRNMVFHADKPVVKDYAEKVQQLSFDRFKGYITGFIDVCFLHEGKAYVLDWKSNFLGPNGEAYEQLDHVMFQHDYLLQYHLYVLAVHQHLQKKIPDYDYDEHFGGVIYPFLRGLKAGSSRGLYFDRPPKALICGLEKDMIETRETEGAFHG